MDIIFIAFPLLVTIFIIFAAPTDIKEANKKRAAKGKPILTENEYKKVVTRGRIIACIIIAVSFLIAVAIRTLVR